MKKPLKILAIALGGLISLIVAAAIALPLFFDPNHYRSEITDYVKKTYGRTLEIGDVKLSVFPWVRVQLHDVKLDNAQGFGKSNMAEVGTLNVGVKLLPLIFDRKVEASAVELDGLKLDLAKNAEGRSNWDDFLNPKNADAKNDEKKSDEKAGEGFKLSSINIGGIAIDNASLSYRDAQKGQRVGIEQLAVDTGAIDLTDTLIDGVNVKLAKLQYEDTAQKKTYVLENLALKSGTLKPGKSADLDLSVVVNSTAPQARIELKLGGAVLADLEAKTYSVSNLELKADLSGKAVPGEKMNVKLGSDIALDQAQGTVKLSKTKLEAAGVTLTTEITGSGLNGDNPKLSGPITIAPFNPRDVMSALGMKGSEPSDKTALTSASFSAQYSGSFKTATLDKIALVLDQTHINGNIAVRDLATQAIEFTLKGDSIDADRYKSAKSAAAASEGGGAGGGGSKSAGLNDIKLPSEALAKLNANGTLTFNSVKVSGVKLTDVTLRVSGSGNTPKTQQVSAKLYGGTVAASNQFTADGKPRYALKTNLQSISAGSFLGDFLGKDYISGLGNFNIDLTGAGNTVGDLRRTLNGDLSLKLDKGVVKGFNLTQILSKGQALLSGQAAASGSDAPAQTEFSTFTASAKIINGILQTNALEAASSLFKLTGAGSVDLVNETIDYTAKPTILASLGGGKVLEQLKGMTIPIKLSGSLYSPHYQLELTDVVKDKAKAKLTELLQQKLGNGASGTDANDPNAQTKKDLGGALLNLLNKK